MRSWYEVVRPVFFLLAAAAAPLRAESGPDLSPLLPAGTLIEADEIIREGSGVIEARGQVRLVRGAEQIEAERLALDEPTDTLYAVGEVRFSNPEAGFFLKGSAARYNFTNRSGLLQELYFRFEPTPQQPELIPSTGRARLLEYEKERYELKEASWTSCSAANPDWQLEAEKLTLDRAREEGSAEGVRLRIFDTTLLALPWLEFPLSKKRRSGWLVPHFGVSSRSGLQLALPYYFNLAPNYDATLTTRLFAKRGVQLGAELRYLTPAHQGTIELEVLPNDWSANQQTRAMGMLRHRSSWERWHFSSDLHLVSDREYLRDLSQQLASAATLHLLRHASLRYQGEVFSSELLLEGYQTLSREALTPYRRLPEWRWTMGQGLGPGLLTLTGAWTAFRHPRQGERSGFGDLFLAEGVRIWAMPRYQLRFGSPWWFVEPALALHMSRYALSAPARAEGRTEINRFVPIATLDAQLFLERDWSLGEHAWLQTLEPRLFLRAAPYRYQDDLPLFDTDRFGFGFAQLFVPNAFAGEDRIMDGASATLALTTRFLEPFSGEERMRFSVAQRLDLDPGKVRLPDEPLYSAKRSDLLFEAIWQPAKRWRLMGFWQYDPKLNEQRRFNSALHYEAGLHRVLSAGYRYTRDLLEEVFVAAQWPIAPRWVGVGRIAHSLAEARTTEWLAGAEYQAGCWVGRIVAHRYALSEARSNTALFVQLELYGLGALGSDPSLLLRRSVPGYGRIAPSAAATPWPSAADAF